MMMKMIIMKEPLILSLLRFRDSHARPSRAQWDRVCARVRVRICSCVAIWLSLCHWFYLETLFIYLFIYVFNYLPFSALWPLVLVSSRKPRLCVAILQSGGVALCLSCVCVWVCWGGWCQRTLAEASVLKCNDTWFLLIHSHVRAKVHMYAHNCGN